MRVITDMSNAAYHAHHAVSKSTLDKIARSPLHCKAYLDGVRTEPTAAMQFGTALHTAVLEPAKFSDEFAVFDGDRRTKAGKAEYEELAAAGKIVLKREDRDAIRSMREAVFAHPEARELLWNRGLRVEHSVFWTDAVTGLECKCRPDGWGEGYIADVKTTEDASPEGFARSVATYRYHVQAAHYMAGTGINRFFFVAIEKKPPYAVAVYELDSIALALGEQIRRENLMLYAECQASGFWPGYGNTVQTLSLPPWAFPSGDGEEEIEIAFAE